MMELIHMTATYSNAVLVAILPHISDFAKKLDLPITQPITTEQVARFAPSPYKGRVEGALWLTNGYWFMFRSAGYVDSFRTPDDVFYDLEYVMEHLTNYMGQTRMTTNEIIALARVTLLKLGYKPDITHADGMPEMQGPFDLKEGGHMPYCKLWWEPVKDFDSDGYSRIQMEINTREKRVVGFYLDFARTNRSKIGTPLKVDVEPELESEFRKRTGVKLFVRTNAPPRVPFVQTNRTSASP
jgi:hypothetical protein